MKSFLNQKTRPKFCNMNMQTKFSDKVYGNKNYYSKLYKKEQKN